MKRSGTFSGCLTVILFLLLGGNCYSKVIKIFVSVNGNDSWSGTSVQALSPNGPMQTLQGAINALLKMNISKDDSIVVLLSPGTYYLDKAIIINKPLPFNNPLTISRYGNGEVKISGLRKISNDKVTIKGKYWVINTGDNNNAVSQLMVNNVLVQQAVFPSTNYLKFDSVSQTILKKPLSASLLSDSVIHTFYIDPAIISKIKDEFSSCAEIEIFNKWYFIRRSIKEIDNGKLIVVGQEMPRIAMWQKGTRFRIANSGMGLTQGNWIFNKKTSNIYYYPKTGETPGNSALYIPVIQQLLIIKGSGTTNTIDNIHVENLTFEGSGYDISNNGILPMQTAFNYDAAIEVSYAKNITFNNCAFSNISLNALWLNQCVLNSSINGCYFNNLGMAALKIGEPKPNGVGVILPSTGNNTIKNCLIQNGGNLNPSAAAIAVFQSGNNIISNNEISDFYYTGISMGWTWGNGKSYAVNNLVSKNHIHHIGKGMLDDMGGIYMLGNSAGTQLTDNVIHHIYSYDYGGWGIYLDQGSANIKITGNLVLNTKSACFFQSSGRNNEVSGNIFVNGNIDQLQLGVSAKLPDTSLVFRDNIILKKDGEWFSGAWKVPGVYMKNNTFGLLNSASDKNGFTNAKAVVSANSTSNYTAFKDVGVDAKDDYTNQDINSLLAALKINKTYASGCNNNWTRMANSKKNGFYNGFTSKMKNTTLFRKDQVGR